MCPPGGTASRALSRMLTNTCMSWPSLPRTGGSVGSRSSRIVMVFLVNWCSSRATDSRSSSLRETGPSSVVWTRAKLSRFWTISEARKHWLSIFLSMPWWGWLWPVSSMSIWVKLLMPVSGVFTSWATPAAMRPSDESFSAWSNWVSSCTRAVMSSNTSSVPATCPVSLTNGLTVKFTKRLSPRRFSMNSL